MSDKVDSWAYPREDADSLLPRALMAAQRDLLKLMRQSGGGLIYHEAAWIRTQLSASSGTTTMEIAQDKATERVNFMFREATAVFKMSLINFLISFFLMDTMLGKTLVGIGYIAEVARVVRISVVRSKGTKKEDRWLLWENSKSLTTEYLRNALGHVTSTIIYAADHGGNKDHAKAAKERAQAVFEFACLDRLAV